MGVGVGIEIAGEQADKLSRIIAQLIKSVSDVNVALLNKVDMKYIDKGIDKGTKTIMEHMHAGGDIARHEVPDDKSAAFESALKTYRVPYMKMQARNENGVLTDIYLTRKGSLPDTKVSLPDDSSKVMLAYKRFMMHTEFSLGEQRASEFIKANENGEIVKISGITPEERFLIRSEFKGAFAFLRNENDPNKYELLYRKQDEPAMNNCLKDVSYMLSGEKGEQYKSELRYSLDAEKDFSSQLKVTGNDRVFVVDREHPNNFFCVTKDGFSYHSLQESKEKTANGVAKYISDVGAVKYSGHRDMVRKIENAINHPVIVKDLPYVKSVSDGKLILSEPAQVRAGNDALKELIKDSDYLHRPVMPEPSKGENYMTLKDLSDNEMSMLMNAFYNHPDEVIKESDSIAFPIEYKAEAMEALNVMYSKQPDIERIDKISRVTGHGEIQEKCFLVDTNPERRSVVILKDKDSLDIMEGKRVLSHYEGKEAETMFVKFYASMSEPIILSEKEMSLPVEERNSIIESRTYKNISSPAMDKALDFDRAKMRELYDVERGSDTSHLDGRQKEAIERTLRYEKEDIYVNKDFIDKIQTMDFSDTKVKQNERVVER